MFDARQLDNLDHMEDCDLGGSILKWFYGNGFL